MGLFYILVKIRLSGQIGRGMQTLLHLINATLMLLEIKTTLN